MSKRGLEKLDIVFRLHSRSGDEQRVGESKLASFLKTGGIDDAHALQLAISTLRQRGISDIEVSGRKIAATSYLSQVEKQGKWHQTISADGLSFRFGHVVALAQSFLVIEENRVGAGKSWEDWMTPFFSEKEFVQAWISDVDYDTWQNAKSPLQYEAAGRSYASLPMKTNGLPAPLGQMEIDTSANPGRWILKTGYVESIGSTMWLGPLFWASVGMHRKDALLSDQRFTVQSLSEGIIKVVTSDSCFCDETTENIQQILRTILYS